MTETTGYSRTPLIKKLGIKPGMTVFFSQPPDHYPGLLGPLPGDVERWDGEGQVDFIHHFERSSEALERDFPELKSLIKKNGSLWVSWPKMSSKLESDLKDGIVRKIGLAAGLVDVKVCAVDQDWSGLKFMYRTKDR